MTIVTISENAQAAWPTLAPVLAGGGIVAGIGSFTIFSFDNAKSATAGDVIIESTAPTTAPYLVSFGTVTRRGSVLALRTWLLVMP